MVHRLGDRVRETSNTTGTGPLTLAGAVAGFQGFADYLADGDTTLYVIESDDGSQWEVGFGTWTASGSVLARTTVYQSSNSDALVNFTDTPLKVRITFSTAGPVGAMTAGAPPRIISVGAEFTSTGAPTATLPATHALNDILVLVLQSTQENLATPAGYTRLGPQNGIGAAVTAGSTRMGIFWKRDNGSESAPSVADAGDHTYGFMFAVRGCPTVGDPFHFIANNWKFTTSTAGTAKGGDTVVDNCLITAIFGHAVDNASGQSSGETNASLSSLTEEFDNATTDGLGGGLTLISGIKAAAGPVSDTTITWANTTVDVSSTIAWIPEAAFEIARRASEVQVFIGSPANINDVWTKPAGARSVFVQLIDGGGSGSGGNTTTTAAGGGGGGGGGYDEAMFRASDLAATHTVLAGGGGAAGTALNQAGAVGQLSNFTPSSGLNPFETRVAGIAATAAASADGGNGGSGSGGGRVSPAVATTRLSPEVTTDGVAYGTIGGRGGSGTTAPVGGSPADWGGGGGESGADTDAATASTNNGYSKRGGGGGSSGRTNGNISVGGYGGGAQAGATQGVAGNDSAILPYGGGGGNGGGATTPVGGAGGFPGGGGGGGGGVAGGFGGRGGHGCVVVTTYF